jgi:hypothetical protein
MFRLIKVFSPALLACAFNTSLLFAQFLGLSSDVHATSEQGTTYPIYAHFNSLTDEVLAAYSIGTSETGSVSLKLGVTTSFFQDASFGHRRIASGRRAAFRSSRPARRAKLGVLRSDGHQTLGVDVWSGSGNGVRLPESIRRVIASECCGGDARLLELRIDRCRGQGRGATAHGLASQRRIHGDMGGAGPRSGNVHVQNFEGRCGATHHARAQALKIDLR